MKSLSIETQRELVEALENILAFDSEGDIGDEADYHITDGAYVRQSDALSMTLYQAKEMLAKARAEMGGDGNG